ncbi:hypothetical protein [Lysobacter brunescens]|uniref:Secreted protein n=1 Tax=Lysobacter brunescens TaxID=262323 RepID=A0ABW2YFZ6_9GAMM
MSLQVVLSIALAAGASGDSGLCKGMVNRIEPDMRVRVSDLDRAAANAATDKLRQMIDRGEVDGDYRFGALNQLKIIRGHLLLEQAQADRRAFGANSAKAKGSEKVFCDWLGKDGFWHD